jgi:hypothetical protein
LLRLVTSHFRHEDVEQDDVEWFGSSASSAWPPVRDGGDKVTLPLDVAGQEMRLSGSSSTMRMDA